MANGDTRGAHNALLYGIIGALCVVVIGGGIYLFKTADKPAAVPVQAVTPAPPPPPPAPPVAAPRPAPPAAPAPPAGPSAAQIGQARALIADARRFASLGDFAGAEAALQNADKAAPGFAEVAQARQDIAQMRTARGELGRLIERTRGAIQRGDFVTAERLLAEAERIDANAPEVLEARRELQAAERQVNRPQDGRVVVLVTAARAAMALGDLASADRALDQAEQIDPRDPAVIQARADLRAAQRTPRPGRN